MQKIQNKFWINLIPMITTRPKRKWDDKISVSINEFNALNGDGELFWVHKNLNWYQYWYQKRKLLQSGIYLMEINPVFQNYLDIQNTIYNNWSSIIYWFWLISEKEYLITNLKNRESWISDEILESKLRMWEQIQNSILEIRNKNIDNFKVIKVSFDNRDLFLDEILNYVNDSI